ncbi:expressed unknown protein [Seminavis robusta]|uniref:Uncharacterized protein n=1 Tax=Seminavis robusta TaxID=568900 RepID=A0A9N8E762_9STRA|nr:expressed unknown protein [Seminavis robusta]|eukprot:Sro585_g171040.1 n/a (562) ;mRNA; r:33423-35340
MVVQSKSSSSDADVHADQANVITDLVINSNSTTVTTKADSECELEEDLPKEDNEVVDIEEANDVLVDLEVAMVEGKQEVDVDLVAELLSQLGSQSNDEDCTDMRVPKQKVDLQDKRPRTGGDSCTETSRTYLSNLLGEDQFKEDIDVMIDEVDDVLTDLENAWPPRPSPASRASSFVHRFFPRSHSHHDVGANRDNDHHANVFAASVSAPSMITMNRKQSDPHSSVKRSMLLAQDFSFKIPSNTRGISERTFGVETVIEPHNGDTAVPVFVGLDDTPEDKATLQHQIRELISEAHWLIQVFTTIVAAFLTYSLVNEGEQFNHQIATMAVIVLIGESQPQLVTAAGCGAFAGGQYTQTIPNYGWLFLLSIATASAWLLVQRYKLLLGFSGRLGTTTFIAMNTTMILFIGPSKAVPWNQYGNAALLWGDRLLLEPSLMFLASVIVMAGVCGAFRLNAKMPVSPVLLPVKFALLAMMIVNATGYSYRNACFNGFAVGAYVAMASEARIPSVLSFVAAGCFAGLWGLFLAPFFVGFGGKGGFTATLGYTTYYVLTVVLSKIRSKL